MPHSLRWTASALLASLLALALIAAACGGDEDHTDDTTGERIERSPQTPIVVPPGGPILVGVSAPLTGPDATVGIQDRDAVIVGVELWKEKNGETIGGHEIEVHAADDGCSDAETTLKAAGRLLRLQGLVGVMGPDCSAGASRVIPVYARAGIVMISGSATRSDLTRSQGEPRFFFRTAYTNAQEGALQARYAVEMLNAATAYVIDDSEAYGTDLANSVQALLRARGVAITRESVERGAVDFGDLAARISGDNPDVVIFEGFNPEGALFYRQMRDAGYQGPFVSADGVASLSDFIEPLGDQAEGAVFAGCLTELPGEFLADFVEITGHQPTTPFPAQYADAATILLDAAAKVAVEQADGSLVIDPLELRDAVSRSVLVGFSGIIGFDEKGDRVGEGRDVGLVMCRVEDGEFVNFEF